MSRINWSELLEHRGDELLTWLHDVEQWCKRAIRGIWLFIVRKLPRLFREFMQWLEKHCFYALRVAVRLSRILGLLACLALIVLGPAIVYPGLLTFCWLVLSVTGAIWYVQTRPLETTTVSLSRKEQNHARA